LRCLATPPQITRYEKAWDRPGRATTLNICRDFNLNEKWLTSGERPIYRNTVSKPGKFVITNPPSAVAAEFKLRDPEKSPPPKQKARPKPKSKNQFNLGINAEAE
jgi:hypothetical protein